MSNLTQKTVAKMKKCWANKANAVYGKTMENFKNKNKHKYRLFCQAIKVLFWFLL